MVYYNSEVDTEIVRETVTRLRHKKICYTIFAYSLAFLAFMLISAALEPSTGYAHRSFSPPPELCISVRQAEPNILFGSHWWSH